MGIFNRKNDNDEEFLIVLGEIRDQLKVNNNDVLQELESKISDAHYSNDEEVGVMANKISKMENIIHLHEKSIANLEHMTEKQSEKIETLIDVNKKLTEIIKIMNLPKEEVTVKIPEENNFKTKWDDQPVTSSEPTQPEIIPKIRKGDTITAYGKKWKGGGYINIKRIDYLDKNGKFKRNGAGQRYFNWDIHTILKLKRIMREPEKYPTMLNLGDEIGFSSTATKALGYHILNGDFDQYLNEWEQMEMKKHYGNWKPSIENNPEKRKEKGYC